MKKTCTKCRKRRKVSEFSKDNGRIDGLCLTCKKCQKTYYTKNRDKINKRCKIYNAKNKDEISQLKKAYRIKNRDKVLKWQKTYKDKNRDKINASFAEKIKNLDDYYLKDLILRQYNTVCQDITPEMIEAKRKELTTYRKMKETRDELNSARD